MVGIRATQLQRRGESTRIRVSQGSQHQGAAARSVDTLSPVGADGRRESNRAASCLASAYINQPVQIAVDIILESPAAGP